MVNIHDAKTQLSKLIEKVERGEEVIIARAGKPVARLSQLQPKPKKRALGFLSEFGYVVPDDIKTPFKDEIEEMFYGGPDKFKNL
jgi:antitoxin (DNA-binding transcriptional repressor) of toxin-antitoxin stability system